VQHGLFHAVFLAELVHPAGGIDNLLLAGKERMAGGADFDTQVMGGGAAGLEAVATAAGYVHFDVIRMDIGFHWETSCWLGPPPEPSVRHGTAK
jgi:hypothetical protein